MFQNSICSTSRDPALNVWGALSYLAGLCECSWKLWVLQSHPGLLMFKFSQTYNITPPWECFLVLYMALTHKQAALSHYNSIEGKLKITGVEYKHVATHLWCKVLLNPIATVTSVTNYHSERNSRDRRATEERRRVECHGWRLHWAHLPKGWENNR